MGAPLRAGHRIEDTKKVNNFNLRFTLLRSAKLFSAQHKSMGILLGKRVSPIPY